MHLHLFLLLFSSGASSYFLPLKETLHLQNETPTLIHEMLCLLKAENTSIEMNFSKPLYIKNKSCAHNITQQFIKELENITVDECMKMVEVDMRVLEKECAVLGKSSSNDKECSAVKESNFHGFKKSLEEFLKWVNEMNYCKKIPRWSGFYLGGKCNCSGMWKNHNRLL